MVFDGSHGQQRRGGIFEDRTIESNPRDDDAARVEPAIGRRQIDKGANEQRRPDEQRAGERDLRDEQSARDGLCTAGLGSAAFGHAQRLNRIDVRADPGRQQSRREHRHDTRCRRDTKRAQIDVQRIQRAQEQGFGRSTRAVEMSAQARPMPATTPSAPMTPLSTNAWRITRAREAPSAERMLNSRRRSVSRASNKLLDVRAQHEKDEHHAAGKERHGAFIVGVEHVGGERPNLRLQLRVASVCGACGVLRKTKGVGPRHIGEPHVDDGKRARVRRGCCEIDCSPDLGVPRGEAELRRQNADDEQRLAVDGDAAADNGRIAVVQRSPEIFRQEDAIVCAGAPF